MWCGPAWMPYAQGSFLTIISFSPSVPAVVGEGEQPLDSTLMALCHPHPLHPQAHLQHWSDSTLSCEKKDTVVCPSLVSHSQSGVLLTQTMISEGYESDMSRSLLGSSCLHPWWDCNTVKEGFGEGTDCEERAIMGRTRTQSSVCSGAWLQFEGPVQPGCWRLLVCLGNGNGNVDAVSPNELYLLDYHHV